MSQINKPSDYFNTKLYSGTGSSQSITGVGFQPDWVWIKERNGTNEHNLFDIIRGTTKRLESSTTAVEQTSSTTLTAFGSDGFTVGSNPGTGQSGSTYASWNWKAGGTASSNTDGSITSNVSASTTSGFSIVSYTANNTAGATVGHGLGVVPKMVIVKRLAGSAQDWSIYHTSLGNTKRLSFNLNEATVTDSTAWNNTSPTSSVFSLGTSNKVNGSGSDGYIAYCFSEKKGFSKFGSYVGNGNADGTFVYTGFKPAFIITKPTDNISSWNMSDVDRSTFNDGSLERLKANSSDAETSTANYDILSNGFKIRTTDNDYNYSGGTMIYMAFASEPLTGTNGVPCTAR